MSALARFFHAMGKKVFGYDKTSSPLTETLAQEGMEICYIDTLDSLPRQIVDNPEESLVIYTPAIPRDSVLLQFFGSENYALMKRSEVLGMVTDETINLSVAGTHGKTTTSCMLAAIFKASGLKFTAFLGGISADLDSNYYHQTAEGVHYSISEADEYDRSFLKLNPSSAIITSTDADHLDIYGSKEEVQDSFELFASKVIDKDLLLVAKGANINAHHISYSVDDVTADYYAENVIYRGSGSSFDLMENGMVVFHNLTVKLPGKHNLENAIAASVLALKQQVDPESIRTALANFKGIKRRFEYIYEDDKLVYIDDYAHHPSELNVLIDSLKLMYPDRKITGVFQPHLYSRTKDFYLEFARALDRLDHCILLPIYPARESPVKGVSSSLILNEMQLAQKVLLEKNDLIPYLSSQEMEILVTIGAGDIDRLIEPIKEALNG